MAESLISDRVLFPNKQSQKKFLMEVKKYSGLNWSQLADISNISRRALSDWRSGKSNMSYKTACSLSKLSKVSLPKNIKIKKWKDHLKKISKIGGQARFKKYGSVCSDEKYRKTQWEQWWKKIGQFKKIPIYERKSILYPQKDSELAEFVGIMMGDGSVAKFHTAITLNRIADKDYIIFVSKLIKRLFGITPKIYNDKKSLATDIVVHRKNLVDYCQSIGLPLGDKLKQGLDIPNWIKENDSFSIACIRGLVDTDGSVFYHRYKVSGKQYCYTKMAFTSHSLPLIKSVQNILIKHGFNARISYNSKDIRIESQKDVEKYANLIGTNNPKHKRKLNGGLRRMVRQRIANP